MEKTLTVVIATYNRAKSLNLCLHSLTKQTDRHFNVLIIDGGSKDETQDVVKKYRKKLKIQLIVDKTQHLAYIRDLGWRKANGEIIASIDDDAVVSAGWVRAIKLVFKDNSIGGVTGPTVVPKNLLTNRDVFLFYTTRNRFLKFLGKIYFHLFMEGKKNQIGKIYPSGAWSPGSNFPFSLKLRDQINVDYLEACNFAVLRKVLRKIGGYDLKYKGTSEWCEVDLAFRIRKIGYKLIFDPTVTVEHLVSTGGVYTYRTNFFHRLQNFLRFYIYRYYPKTLFGFFQFFLYLNFLILYGMYLELKHRKRHLGFFAEII